MDSLLISYRLLFDTGSLPDRSVLEDLDGETVRKAWRRMALRFHPDAVHNPDRGAERFIEVCEAYKRLSAYAKITRSTESPSASTAKARSPRSAVHGKQPKEIYYRGPVPHYRLRLAEYLYYSRAVSWNAMIRAIVRQKSAGERRAPIGRYFVENGLLTPERMAECVRQFHLHNLTWGSREGGGAEPGPERSAVRSTGQ